MLARINRSISLAAIAMARPNPSTTRILAGLSDHPIAGKPAGTAALTPVRFPTAFWQKHVRRGWAQAGEAAM
jgi:hypothetical protein